MIVSIAPHTTLKKVGLFGVKHMDKVGHLVFYFVLALFLMHGLKKASAMRPQKAFVLSVILCCIFGLLLEIIQWQIASGRRFEVLDIIANIIGALIGCTVFNKVLKERFYGN